MDEVLRSLTITSFRAVKSDYTGQGKQDLTLDLLCQKTLYEVKSIQRLGAHWLNPLRANGKNDWTGKDDLTLFP